VGTCVGEVFLGRRRSRRSSELELSGVVEMQQGRVRMRNGENGTKTSGGGDDDHREVATEGKQLEQKLLTIPTILTLTRVAAVPAMLAVFYSQERWATTAVATIFVLAAITDWLDGYLARKMGSSSEFGAFLDPVADKLMVATTLVLLCTRPPAMAWARVAPWLLPLPAIAIIGREITMSAVREWAASQGEEMHKVSLVLCRSNVTI
jgi:CDP-diacylglycerol--glycerol-3-phosphate 3-phosphatidyltransferase